MAIYIDELFVLNLILDYLLLHGAAMLSGTPFRRVRLGCGAALGAVYACLLFFPAFRLLDSLWGKAAVSLLMSLAAYGWQDLRSFLRRTLVFYTVSFVFAGAMMALFHISGAGRSGLPGGILDTGLNLPVLLAVAFGTWLVLTLFLRDTPKLSQQAPPRTPLRITLFGQTAELEALVDTGNRLRDPMTNESVAVVEYPRIRALLPRELRAVLDVCGVEDAPGTLRLLHTAGLQEGFHLLPFSAVGTQRGLLLALRAEQIQAGDKVLEQPLLALTQGGLADKTGCGAVIGA